MMHLHQNASCTTHVVSPNAYNQKEQHFTYEEEFVSGRRFVLTESARLCHVIKRTDPIERCMITNSYFNYAYLS